jgi:glycosyltransferase involved in cell wall biosynthesis
VTALPTLGLAIIARTEQDTLPRLLASCVGAFDEIALVDTGSEDATVERFETWAASQPMTVCHLRRFEWCDDFAAARNVAVGLLDTEWWTWADCDDVIHGAGALRLLAACAPEGAVMLNCPYELDPSVGEVNWRERLVKAGGGRWTGRVHEYVAPTDGGAIVDAPRDLVRWRHVGDGGGKTPGALNPRRVRDLAILTAEVCARPQDTRAIYYLAQTHRDLGHRELAIECYERRAGMGGFDQEAYQARFEASLLRADGGDWERGMAGLLAAWEMRPIRAEPLYELARLCRSREQHRSAHMFAQRGLLIPQPHDRLSLRTWVYSYGLPFEAALACLRVGDRERGLELCGRLLRLDELPAEHRQQLQAALHQRDG